jgi:predicted histone-like DNA-binding protein
MVNYVLVQRLADPRDPKGAKKYFAQVKNKGETTVRELAVQISKRTGLSVSDVMATIEAFIDIVPELISYGQIVRLGDFGSFSLSIRSEGVTNKSDFTSDKIKDNSLNFHSGKVIRKVLDVVDYKLE